MTQRFSPRPLVGEKYRNNIRKEIYTIERVRQGSVDIRVGDAATQTWFMDIFIEMVNAGKIELVESKHRGTLA